MATGSIHFIPQRDKGKSSVTLSPRWLRPLTPPNALFQPTFVRLNTLFQGSFEKVGVFR